MIFEQILASLKLAWSFAPFPWLLLILILLAYAWLWLEKQLTHMGRATPGLRRPWPVLPQISTVFVYVIIWSKRLLILWVILLLVVAGVLFAASEVPDFPPIITENVLKVAALWHNAYTFIMELMPGPLVERLAQQEANGGLLPALMASGKDEPRPTPTVIPALTPTTTPSPTPLSSSHQPGHYAEER